MSYCISDITPTNAGLVYMFWFLYLKGMSSRTRVDKKPFSVGRDQTKYEQRTKQNRKELHFENIIMSGENNV